VNQNGGAEGPIQPTIYDKAMKLTAALLPIAATTMLAAQTSVHPPVHRVGAAPVHASAQCATLPEVSAKIPALSGGRACAKILYTMRVDPPVKLEYVSPIEGSAVEDTLGLQSETFSLLYVDTKVGTGELAQPKKWYSIRYTGYLSDGTVFDSNANKTDQPPFSFPYGAHHVINGWDTGFAGMRVGGKRRLFIPYQLAYGANGRPPGIPPKSMLIFDVEFVGQSDTDPQPAMPPASSAPQPSGTNGAPAGTTPNPQ
jgi:peptidylprolyl isomerase